MAESLPTIQLVDGQGNFNGEALSSFVKAVGLSDCGLSYAVVSIMGPQSSGKSTLLNHVFYTRFREMDAMKGRCQTTQGIWLAKAVDMDPCTLVLDLEGTDGRERGEDDTTFERQSALFALAVSDIVLVNLWCHDIGREHAANKPLLKTVFQAMMRLFTPRKSTLLFVIRDKTKTPLEILAPILQIDVEKIWDSVFKPEKHKNTPLSEFFNVEITALPSYEDKEEHFKEQASLLRQRFFNSIAPGGLAGDRREAVPGSGFPLSIEEIWKVVKSNKDLDLPAHKIMVATVRCEEIIHEILMRLEEDEEWWTLETDAKAGPIPNFGKKLNHLLDKYLSWYDAEAAFLDQGVRVTKKQMLLAKALDIVHPSYQVVVGHHKAKALSRFKHDLELYVDVDGFAKTMHTCKEACLADFDQGCADASVPVAGWDPSKMREKLLCNIEAHSTLIKSNKLAEIVVKFEKRLDNSLAEPVASLLDAATPNSWSAIRKLLFQETEAAKSDLSATIAGFELHKEEELKILQNLQETGRSIVEKKAKEEASQALVRMKDRFNTAFTYDAESIPRVWTGKENIQVIIRDARISALRLLSVLAVLRLDNERPDNVEPALMCLLETSSEEMQSSATALLASSMWEGVPPIETFITPVQCRMLWRQFNAETEYIINQAVAAQVASRHRSSWLPPAWAIFAMIILGFNEFMTLLRNPIYLAISFVIWLLGRAIWIQLNVSAEFHHGFLPGITFLLSRFLPTLMNILRKLAEEGQKVMDHNGSDTNSSSSDFNRLKSRDISHPSSNETESVIDFESSSSLRHRPPPKTAFSS
eukprot:c28372_g1_i1 orf=326-2764(-)